MMRPMPTVSYGFMSEMFKPRSVTPPRKAGNPSVEEADVLERVATDRTEEWLEENDEWDLAAEVTELDSDY